MPALLGPGGGGTDPARRVKLDINREWIEKVANIPDNDLRAHSIALTYCYVAEYLDALLLCEEENQARAKRTGHTAYNANWFHFATWATLTVTQNIGNQRAPQRLNHGVAAPLRRALTPAILRAKAAQGQRVGRALAWAQRLIFVAATMTLLEFADRHHGKRPSRSLNDDLSEDCIEATQITSLTTSADGVSFFDPRRHFDPIWRAFQLYELARGPDVSPVVRARLVFGGNLLLTAVEQDLVNNAVGVVVDHIPTQINGSIDWRIAKMAERLRGVPPQLSYSVLQMRRGPGPQLLDTVWSRLMTDQVLVLALPTETLRVGRDIPPRHREWPYFPPQLRDLDDGVGRTDATTRMALDDIRRHVKSLDRTSGDGRGSAARDWRRWDERMNWALTLLRSRQQDETLFWRPYSVDDIRRIRHGQLPTRSGDPSALDVQPPLGVGVLPAIRLGDGR